MCGWVTYIVNLRITNVCLSICMCIKSREKEKENYIKQTAFNVYIKIIILKGIFYAVMLKNINTNFVIVKYLIK